MLLIATSHQQGIFQVFRSQSVVFPLLLALHRTADGQTQPFTMHPHGKEQPGDAQLMHLGAELIISLAVF